MAVLEFPDGERIEYATDLPSKIALASAFLAYGEGNAPEDEPGMMLAFVVADVNGRHAQELHLGIGAEHFLNIAADAAKAIPDGVQRLQARLEAR